MKKIKEENTGEISVTHYVEIGFDTKNQEFDRKLINQLYNEWEASYQSMRKELDEHFGYVDGPFGDIMLFGEYIWPFARQLEKTGSIENPDEALDEDDPQSIKRTSIFQVDDIKEFYLSSANLCVITKQYIERMDYLRLLLIDYCENYLVKKEDAT